MKIEELVQVVEKSYQEKGIARCRYNALDKVVDFIIRNKPEVRQDVSLLATIEKKDLKSNYENSKDYKKLNGAEKQAINDLYNNLK